MAGVAQFFKTMREQKAAVVESRDQVLHQLAHFELAGALGEHLAEIKSGLFTVEAAQGLNEWRRNNERRVRVAEGIAQHQPGSFGDRRRQELDVKP